jgi:hypothetical protein
MCALDRFLTGNADLRVQSAARAKEAQERLSMKKIA